MKPLLLVLTHYESTFNTFKYTLILIFELFALLDRRLSRNLLFRAISSHPQRSLFLPVVRFGLFSLNVKWPRNGNCLSLKSSEILQILNLLFKLLWRGLMYVPIISFTSVLLFTFFVIQDPIIQRKGFLSLYDNYFLIFLG